MNKAVHVDELPLATPTQAPTDFKRSSPAQAFDPDRFDWEKDADCVILHEQPATAIYHGGGGHVVIRQTNGHEEDVTILIAPENANRFMDGIADFLRRK
jgi:hypothetical protein